MHVNGDDGDDDILLLFLANNWVDIYNNWVDIYNNWVGIYNSTSSIICFQHVLLAISVLIVLVNVTVQDVKPVMTRMAVKMVVRTGGSQQHVVWK